MFQKQYLEKFYKKIDLKNFTKFTEKHGSRSLFLKKFQVSGLQINTPTHLFASEFWENVKNYFWMFVFQ